MKITRQTLIEFLLSEPGYRKNKLFIGSLLGSAKDEASFYADKLIEAGFVKVDEPREFYVCDRCLAGSKNRNYFIENAHWFRPCPESDKVICKGKPIHVREVIE